MSSFIQRWHAAWVVLEYPWFRRARWYEAFWNFFVGYKRSKALRLQKGREYIADAYRWRFLAIERKEEIEGLLDAFREKEWIAAVHRELSTLEEKYRHDH